MPRGIAKVVTKANRRPVRHTWPPDPARVRSIVEGLEELYPEVDCELDRETPFQLLCATILSAQTTDQRVNMVRKRRVPWTRSSCAPVNQMPSRSIANRSEERRVGKECRSRWSPYH